MSISYFYLTLRPYLIIFTQKFQTMNRILFFSILIFVQTIFCSLSSQTIELERNYVNSIIQSPNTDDFTKNELIKKWNKFSKEYVYPIIEIDTTKSELQFSDIIEIDSLSKKIIFERCEQWFVLSYFQVFYSNLEAGKMIATASANIPHKSETNSFGNKSKRSGTTKTDYILTLTIKENKIKYEISDMKYYIQSLESEDVMPVISLFPIVSKNSTEWLKSLTYFQNLNKVLMVDLQLTLKNYIDEYKQDYQF